MALVREGAGNRVVTPKKKPIAPSAPVIAPKTVGKVSTPYKAPAPSAPKSKPSTKTTGKVAAPISGSSKVKYAGVGGVPSSPPALVAPQSKVGKADLSVLGAGDTGGSTAPYSGGGGYGSSGGGGGGSVGGTSATMPGTSISAPTGPVGGLGATQTVASTTPSAIAQMALSTLTGGGTAGTFGRRRNRPGAGYNLSLTPEQLRNIALRRVGG